MLLKDLILYFYRNSFIRFLGVGTLGLLTDASMLMLLHPHIGLIPAKIVSYLIAYTVTWICNRNFTFHSQNRLMKEWVKYTIIYSATGALHVLLFAMLVYQFSFLHQHVMLALLITAGVIAVINFGISKYFVFSKTTTVAR